MTSVGEGKAPETPEVLDVSYTPPDGGWVLTLMTEINRSSSTALREGMKDWDKAASGQEHTLGDLAASLASKITMFEFVRRRFDRRWKVLIDQVKEDRTRVMDSLRHEAAYGVRNEDELVWEFLVDIDSFLFEARSTYESLRRFLIRFCRQILDQKESQDEIEQIIANKSKDISWLEDLKKSEISSAMV